MLLYCESFLIILLFMEIEDKRNWRILYGDFKLIIFEFLVEILIFRG